MKKESFCVNYESVQITVSSIDHPIKDENTKHPPPDIQELIAANAPEKRKFRPKTLLRVDYMEPVDGNSIPEDSGYCAISYAWAYKGDVTIYDTKKAKFVDHQKHQIFRYETLDHPLEPAFVDNSSRDLGNRNHNIRRKMFRRDASFKEVIQQICKDFGVEYVWWDEKCIPQENDKKIAEELDKMHLYYKNADYTIVMVPEMTMDPSDNLRNIGDTIEDKVRMMIPYFGEDSEAGLDELTLKKQKFAYHYLVDKLCTTALKSKWAGRAWTLQEALTSDILLFLGTTLHFWSSQLKLPRDYRDHDSESGKPFLATPFYSGNFAQRQLLFACCLRPLKPSACMVLYHAHTRESTKEFDRIKALENIYPDILKKPEYQKRDKKSSKNKGYLKQKLDNFYCELAKKDLSILCFGTPAFDYPSKLDKSVSELPSWTGVRGAHIGIPQNGYTMVQTDFNSYDVDFSKRRIKLKTNSCQPMTLNIIGFPLFDRHKPTNDGDRYDPHWWETPAKIDEHEFGIRPVLELENLEDIEEEFGLKITHVVPMEKITAHNFPDYYDSGSEASRDTDVSEDLDYSFQTSSDHYDSLGYCYDRDYRQDYYLYDDPRYWCTYSLYFSLTMDYDDTYKDCTVLMGVEFPLAYQNFRALPVVKKKNTQDECFVSIGLCITDAPSSHLKKLDRHCDVEETLLIE